MLDRRRMYPARGANDKDPAPGTWRRVVGALKALLQPSPDDLLEAWPVSRRVNRPADDDPGLIERHAATAS